LTPCPISTLLVSTWRLPSSFSRAWAVEVDGVTVDLITAVTALPRRLLPAPSAAELAPIGRSQRASSRLQLIEAAA
jgi:hypothetical protein